MSRLQYFALVAMLGVVTALPPFSVDTSLPAMPAMAEGLVTSTGAVQLSVAAYSFGAAFGQLVIGAFADRYGRRPVLLCVLGLFVLASLGCTLATSIEMLIVLRFLQGAATAGGRVLPRAMVRDLYDREDAARLLAYMLVIGGAAPVIAPVVGGYLSGLFGWRAVFAFMSAYGLLVLGLSVFFLRETLPQDRQVPLHPRTTLRNVGLIARNRVFLGYTACLCGLSGGLYAFLSVSSTVLIHTLGESPEEYGYDFAVVMAGGVLFNYLSGRLVGSLGLDRMLGIGAAMAAFGGVAMAGLAWAGIHTVWAIVAPMVLYMMAFSFVASAASAGGLSPFPHVAGTAASFMGFLQIAFAATVTVVLGVIDDPSPVAMSSAIGLMGLLILLSYLLLVRRAVPAAAG